MEIPKRTEESRLPVPTKTRFHILRSGLLNIYKYDYEEFRFEEGRLLLRGNNGTGKSRVLALQLPFLLDGEIVPHRVEPDCDPAKRMDWNLLMDKHSDRLGYTWVEFGRQSEKDAEEFVTLGCGLRAVKGKGIHSRWFFVTSQRVGRDLFLQTEQGQPLSREKLELAIAGNGQVFRNAQDYRAAVDQALFQLGDRYHSLIDLLIQLRQPQLSRKLDEDRLSEALSEALPPLSSHLIEDVAESFRSLEADRNELDNYDAAQKGVEAFLKEYSRYVQIAARRRAEQVRKNHSAYESTMRRLRDAEREAAEARSALEETSTQLENLRVHLGAARTEERTLRESPQMKDAQTLDEARTRSREKEAALASRTESQSQSTAHLERARRDLLHQQSLWEEAARNSEQRNAHALNAAAQCGLESAHRESLASPTVFQQPEAKAASQRALDAACDHCQHAIEHLDQRNVQLRAAADELARAEQRFQTAENQLGRLRESERQARETLAAAIESLLDNYSRWADSVTELKPMESESFAAAYRDWLELRQGKNPLLLAVDQARRDADDLLNAARTGVQRELEDTRARRATLTDELERLEQGVHAAPPPPHTRKADDRLDRPGAPLWKLCDFTPNLETPQRAGLEAALESSGLLDAWVTPAGQLLAADTHDQIFVPDFDPSNSPHRSLTDCLVASIDTTDPLASLIDVSTINRILSVVGLGKNTAVHWVDFDGQWRMGPLRGAWSKTEPEHIGHTAREAMRQRKLRELNAQIAGIDSLLQDLEGRLTQLLDRQNIVQKEHQDAPSDQPVLEAGSQLTLINRQVLDAQQLLEESETALAQSRDRHHTVLQQRDADAADLGIDPWKNRLRELERRLGEYRTALAGLWPTIDNLLQARHHHTAAAERARQTETAKSAADEALLQARMELESAQIRYQTLHASVGVAVEEILRQLEQAGQRIEILDADLNAATTQKERLAVREGVANKEIETTTELLTESARRREETIDNLRLFAEHNLLQEAHSELKEVQAGEWSVSQAVELARQVEHLLKNVPTDDDAWRRNQREIHLHIATLQDALLPHGHQPNAIQIEEGIFVVTCGFQGKTRNMTELRRALSEEVLHRQQILDAREREVLENHLIGEVATELQQLIRRGELLVQEMNEELQSRPMSTGMTLRFAWHLDPSGPSGMEIARQHLMSTAGTWSPAEREALGGFLQERIKTVRAANETGTWQEHLNEALDYRRWHRFHVERRQDDQWKRLTRRTYGTSSGGEKAIALTIPQFAAAAAHYRTAAKYAPRLILLDEVFVGIDSDMRGKCMGLLEAFDLDFVMTSEREWGCYPTVSGLAIYQLSSRPGIDAVGLTRWVWNGQNRSQDLSKSPTGRPPAIHNDHLDPSPTNPNPELDPGDDGLLPTFHSPQ